MAFPVQVGILKATSTRRFVTRNFIVDPSKLSRSSKLTTTSMSQFMCVNSSAPINREREMGHLININICDVETPARLHARATVLQWRTCARPVHNIVFQGGRCSHPKCGNQPQWNWARDQLLYRQSANATAFLPAMKIPLEGCPFCAEASTRKMHTNCHATFTLAVVVYIWNYLSMSSTRSVRIVLAGSRRSLAMVARQPSLMDWGNTNERQSTTFRYVTEADRSEKGDSWPLQCYDVDVERWRRERWLRQRWLWWSNKARMKCDIESHHRAFRRPKSPKGHTSLGRNP